MTAPEAALDVSRLTELEQLLGTDRQTLVGTLVSELTTALARIDDGLDARDLGEVASAAHAARNSALMIDAQPVLRALKQLETSARNDEADAASAAGARVRRAWPRLRRGLELAADGSSPSFSASD